MTTTPIPTVGRRDMTILSSGALAGLLSMAALALRGRAEAGSAAAPLNAVSHWLFEERALHLDRADLRHTALGARAERRGHGAASMASDQWACECAPPGAEMSATAWPTFLAFS